MNKKYYINYKSALLHDRKFVNPSYWANRLFIDENAKIYFKNEGFELEEQDKNSSNIWKPAVVLKLLNCQVISDETFKYQWKITRHNVPERVIKKLKNSVFIEDI